MCRWNRPLLLIGAFCSLSSALEGAEDFEGFPPPDLEEDHLQSPPTAQIPERPEVQYVEGTFTPPKYPANALLADYVDSTNEWSSLSDSQYDGAWQVKQGVDWFKNDYRLEMTSEKKHHGIARKLAAPWSVRDRALFGSLEVMYPKSHTCGGAYFKLFNARDSSSLNGKTPYSIMFGPDHCGVFNNKVHLILQKDTGDDARTEFAFDTKARPVEQHNVPHQYGFALQSDNTYKIYVDGEVRSSGTMQEGCPDCFVAPAEIPDPSDVAPEDWVAPPEQIPDMDAVKPDDWDEAQPEFIPDEDAVMPEDWHVDEPLMIPNPNAVKPEDWDDDEDGVWEVPRMKNPKCRVGCGVWAPEKRNPLHKGKWERPMIPNPDYTPVYPRRSIPNPNLWDYSENPFGMIEPFDSIGFELWTVEGGVQIDNVYLGTNEEEFLSWVTGTREERVELEKVNRELEDNAIEEQLKKAADQATPASLRSRIIIGASGCIFSVILCVGAYLLFKRRARSLCTPPAPAKEGEAENLISPATREDDKASEKETEHTTAETETEETTAVRRRKVSEEKAEEPVPVEASKKSD